MAMCGFNNKMLSGLKMFADGLLEQVPKRAQEDKVSIEDSIKQELCEMETFLQVLAKSNQETEFLQGVTHIGVALYKQSLLESGNNNMDDVAKRYHQIADLEINFCSDQMNSIMAHFALMPTIHILH